MVGDGPHRTRRNHRRIPRTKVLQAQPLCSERVVRIAGALAANLLLSVGGLEGRCGSRCVLGIILLPVRAKVDAVDVLDGFRGGTLVARADG